MTSEENCSKNTSLSPRSMQVTQYGSKVMKRLNCLRANKELCDFTVCAEDQSFLVHKVILAGTSDYFRVMYGGEMKESRADTITLQGISASAVECIIDFMYTGQLVLSSDNLGEILNAASHLQVLSAISLCSDFMKSVVTFHNAEELRQIANMYSLEDFVDYLDTHILENFSQFSSTDMFLELESGPLRQYLKSDSLRIQSEWDLFMSVLRWLQYDTPESRTDRLAHNPNSRLSVAVDLMKRIRFPLMSDSDLSRVRESSIMLSPTETQVTEGVRHGLDHTELTKLVIEGIKFGLDCRIGHPLINDRVKVRSSQECMVLIHKDFNFLPLQVVAFNNETKQFSRLFSSTNGSSDYRVAVIDNFLYICCIVDMGGGSLMNSLCRFDPRHLTLQELRAWKQIRLDSAMVALDSKLYVMGGTSEHLNIMNSVECYDVFNNTWSSIECIPVPSHSHAATSVDGCIYISGGITSHNGRPVADLYCFDPGVRKWVSKASMKYARRLHDMVPIDSKVYILGGIPQHGLHHTSSASGIAMECYDVSSDQWTQLTSTLNGRSVGHYVALRGVLYSVGHEHCQATEDEIWQYDRDADVWQKYMKAPQHMSFASAMCSLLYVNFDDNLVADKLIASKPIHTSSTT